MSFGDLLQRLLNVKCREYRSDSERHEALLECVSDVMQNTLEKLHDQFDVKKRDFEQQPYSLDEARVAAFFAARGVGGGDDPIGAVLAGYDLLVFERNQLRKQLAVAESEGLERFVPC